MAVQWLGPHVLTAEGTGSIPGGETKSPTAGTAKEKKKMLLLN